MEGDGRAGRCMSGFSDGRRDDSDINRILLSYRPIAPKPVVGGSSTGGGSSTTPIGKRTKRKYVRVSSSSCKKKQGIVDCGPAERSIVTLQLLPERLDPEAEGTTQSSVASGSWDADNLDLRDVEKNNNDNRVDNNNWYAAEARSRVMESWVTVESVTETCMPEEGGLQYTDESWRRMNDSNAMQQLQGDSCPGFISSGSRVEWVNVAYRRMVGCGSDLNMAVVVWLEIEEKAAAVMSQLARARASFSCWVKVQYSEEEAHRKRPVSMVLPCDAWRIERGGFAWRLDARAALCLGIITDNGGCFGPG